MASPPNGYRSGPRSPVRVKVDASSAAIVVGDMIKEFTAGYYGAATTGSDVLFGVAMEACPVPSADGAKDILVDVSEESIYAMTASTTPTQALVGHYYDITGPQTVDLGASTDDVFYVTGIDIDKVQVLGNIVTKLNAT